MQKLDFKVKYRDLYLPPETPVLVDVPVMTFIMIDGAGDPNDSPGFQRAVEVLYGLSYAIKMSKLAGRQPDGYYEYVVPPLEGLWWVEGGGFSFERRDAWRWTLMVRQPEFVTRGVFEWARAGLAERKGLDVAHGPRLEVFHEGLCVQAMHVGPYSTEPATVARMEEFARANGLLDTLGKGGKHHEIYLSDPRRTRPEALKTVLRHPVERA